MARNKQLNPQHYQGQKPIHPLIKWIVAIIVGFTASLLLMAFMVAQLIEEATSLSFVKELLVRNNGLTRSTTIRLSNGYKLDASQELEDPRRAHDANASLRGHEENDTFEILVVSKGEEADPSTDVTPDGRPIKGYVLAEEILEATYKLGSLS